MALVSDAFKFSAIFAITSLASFFCSVSLNIADLNKETIFTARINCDALLFSPSNFCMVFSLPKLKIPFFGQAKFLKGPYSSSHYGESTHIVKTIGNESSKLLKPLDLIHTGISTTLTSFIGMMVNYVGYAIFNPPSLIHYSSPTINYPLLHRRYWDCKQYQEENLDCSTPVYNLAKRMIQVVCDVGWGNDLYIRGEGVNGLNWTSGIKMKCEGSYWKWEILAPQYSTFSFKVLKNDTLWERGYNRICNTAMFHYSTEF